MRPGLRRALAATQVAVFLVASAGPQTCVPAFAEHSRPRRWPLGPGSAHVQAAVDGPVSYTHLDVYKRQPTGLRILLAEDQAANAYLLQAMLRPGGHAIDVATNGQLAVQHWRERPYDVLLMDLQMPVLDGLGATHEIRRAEAAAGRRRTPIIAISAHAFETDVQRSLDTGCDAHLNKPVAKSDLLAALGRHVPRPAGTAPPPPPPALALEPAPELDPVLAQLATEPGFEVRAALRRMGGEDVYKRQVQACRKR